jgi:hypothetical protein
VEEVVLTPVCVTVTDQQVDEVCEDRILDVNCFDKQCKDGSETVRSLLT